MSEPVAAGQPPLFSPRAVLVLVLVGVVAFAGLAVLAAYAPELRTGDDGRAHALSRSAVGYAGVPILMKGLGEPVTVMRTRPRPSQAAMIVTPDFGAGPETLKPFTGARRLLVVLPKWQAAPDPLRKGFVRKIGEAARERPYNRLFSPYSRSTAIVARAKGVARPVLTGAGPLAGRRFALGPVDQLQTVAGEGWAPLLTDEAGRMVLARSRRQPNVWLLADPDLLNNQGLASLPTARAGAAVLQALSDQGARPILFDVTLAGYERGRGLGRLVLEPPWLAATLCAVAAGLLMGAHALARFGQPRRRERAFALGAAALVDNAADLIRAARKEPELAGAYAALIRGQVLKAGGGHMQEHWLEDLAARRGAASPAELDEAAGAAKTRDDLLAVAQRLYDWRGEMMRERR